MTTTKTKDDADKQLTDTPAPVAVIFGNETYVTDHVPRVTTQHTQEEWLVEALEAKTVLERGDVVSPELIEMLFLDAYDVIAAFTPAARSKKKNGDDDEPDKKHRG